MIKRTQAEAAKVKKILTNTNVKYLQCRTYRRHPFILPPEVSLEDPQSYRRQKMTLLYYCPECTTKRLDSYEVKIDRFDHLELQEMLGRQYVYPEGYQQTIDDPRIEPIEYMQEYLNRMVQFARGK